MTFLARPSGENAGGVISWPGHTARCAIGRGGVCQAQDKREGDGRTPAGIWPLRRLFWRPDRIDLATTRLQSRPIGPSDAWCDDPGCPDYNRLVVRPHPGRTETLWREDHAYDLVVELGYNDCPVIPGAGSAIFMHVAQPHFSPTEGCVALSLSDLVALVSRAQAGDAIQVLMS